MGLSKSLGSGPASHLTTTLRANSPGMALHAGHDLGKHHSVQTVVSKNGFRPVTHNNGNVLRVQVSHFILGKIGKQGLEAREVTLKLLGCHREALVGSPLKLICMQELKHCLLVCSWVCQLAKQIFLLVKYRD